MLRHLHGPAGLQVDRLGPVHGDVLVGAQQCPVRAVEHIGKTIAVEVHQTLSQLAVDIDVHQHDFIDAVVVPLVERRHLIDPFGFAGIDIAGEDAHGPFVVVLAAVAVGLRQRFGAAELRRPQPRIAGAVVHQVQRRIVGIPALRRAATALPLIAHIGVYPQVLAGRAVLRVLFVGVGRQAYVLVAAGAVTRPRAANSSPPKPMMTLSLAMIGAGVMVSPLSGCACFTTHSSLPVAASRAMTKPSKVPNTSLPSAYDMPRLTVSQHARGTADSSRPLVFV